MLQGEKVQFNCIYLPNIEKLFIHSMISVWMKDLYVGSSFGDASIYTAKCNIQSVLCGTTQLKKKLFAQLLLYYPFISFFFLDVFTYSRQRCAHAPLTILMSPQWIYASLWLSLRLDGHLRWFISLVAQNVKLEGAVTFLNLDAYIA